MEQINQTIVHVLEKLYQVQRSLLWDVGKVENLSPVQMQFMIYLEKNPPDLCKVSVLAREFDLTKATVSDAITSLENKSLIVKVMEKTDKRSFYIQLSPKGKKVVKRVSKWADTIQSKIESFDGNEKKVVLVFLMELLKALFDEGAINVPRLCITCNNFERDIKPSSTQPHRCGLTGKYVSDINLNIGCSNFSH